MYWAWKGGSEEAKTSRNNFWHSNSPCVIYPKLHLIISVSIATIFFVTFLLLHLISAWNPYVLPHSEHIICLYACQCVYVCIYMCVWVYVYVQICVNNYANLYFKNFTKHIKINIKNQNWEVNINLSFHFYPL